MPKGDRVEEMLKRFAKMEERKIEDWQYLVPRPTNVFYHEVITFLHDITMIQVPKESSSPKMKVYDRTTYPNDHNAQFFISSVSIETKELVAFVLKNITAWYALDPTYVKF